MSALTVHMLIPQYNVKMGGESDEEDGGSTMGACAMVYTSENWPVSTELMESTAGTLHTSVHRRGEHL